MKKILLAIVILLTAAAAASAQATYIKTKSHTGALEVMGQSQPARDVVSESWIEGDRYASGTPENWMVVDAAKKVAYFINHTDKSYVETTLPLDLAKVLPPEAAGMLDMVQISATVKPGTETKKIGSWNCVSYDATMTVMGMQMTMKIWATTDVPFDYNAYMTKIMPAVLQGQMRFGGAAVAEFAKIKGYQVLTDMTGDIMGAQLRATTEVVEITNKPVPDGVFAPPAGYTKKPTLNPADMIKR